MILTMSEKSLGEYIKNKRLDKHLTRDKLAVILNITAGHLNAIERGVRTPSRDLMRSIANEMELDIEVLYNLLENGTEEKLSQPDTTKPKSRIPDLPPDIELTPEQSAQLEDLIARGLLFSKPLYARLSNRQLLQIIEDATAAFKDRQDADE